MSRPRPLAEIVADRMQVVMALTHANGAELHLRSKALGAEIAAEAGDTRAGGDVKQRLAEAEARIDRLNARLGAIDVELAEARQTEEQEKEPPN